MGRLPVARLCTHNAGGLFLDHETIKVLTALVSGARVRGLVTAIALWTALWIALWFALWIAL